MSTHTAPLIYLNNAADGWPKAPGVAEAVAQVLADPPYHPGRGGHGGADHAAACRSGFAKLFAVPDPARVVLTQHATHALNLALLGLGAAQTRRVVTSVAEHNSILRPLSRLRQVAGSVVEILGLEQGYVDERQFKAALRFKPSLVVLQHASNVTGTVQPIARLFEWAKAAGAVTLLDAAQTAGHIPVHPLELNADLVAVTGRKALHGPPGVGALWVSPTLELEQVITGGTGTRSDMTQHPDEMPSRLEAGTPNTPALAGEATALTWALARDAAVHEHTQRIGQRLLSGLLVIPGVSVYGASDGERTPVVSFSIAGRDNAGVGQALGERYGIACRTGLHCAPLIHAALGSGEPGTVRLSASCFTTEAEIDAALDAVGQLARRGE